MIIRGFWRFFHTNQGNCPFSYWIPSYWLGSRPIGDFPFHISWCRSQFDPRKHWCPLSLFPWCVSLEDWWWHLFPSACSTVPSDISVWLWEKEDVLPTAWHCIANSWETCKELLIMFRDPCLVCRVTKLSSDAWQHTLYTKTYDHPCFEISYQTNYVVFFSCILYKF